jgi:hypothetical protein
MDGYTKEPAFARSRLLAGRPNLCVIRGDQNLKLELTSSTADTMA